MSRVRIPPVLRSHTGGAREIDAGGGTVGEVLSDLVEKHPALGSHLFDDGQLQRYINVYVNNQDIQYLDKLQTPVQPNDTVIILPAMAGG
jgi:molybdopterin converting factor small subunit